MLMDRTRLKLNAIIEERIAKKLDTLKRATSDESDLFVLGRLKLRSRLPADGPWRCQRHRVGSLAGGRVDSSVAPGLPLPHHNDVDIPPWAEKWRYCRSSINVVSSSRKR